MTVEELNSLKPSYDNPITLECDDGYSLHKEIIKVVTPMIKDRFAFIDRDGYLGTVPSSNLDHYPSLKPETEKKRWFELWATGTEGGVFKTGYVVDSEMKSSNGIRLFKDYATALGREVTDEIEKLEWK